METYIQVANAINEDISQILQSTLDGSEPKYRTKERFIRWGLVEQDIHTTVMRHLTADDSANGGDDQRAQRK